MYFLNKKLWTSFKYFTCVKRSNNFVNECVFGIFACLCIKARHSSSLLVSCCLNSFHHKLEYIIYNCLLKVTIKFERAPRIYYKSSLHSSILSICLLYFYFSCVQVTNTERHLLWIIHAIRGKMTILFMTVFKSN